MSNDELDPSRGRSEESRRNEALRTRRRSDRGASPVEALAAKRTTSAKPMLVAYYADWTVYSTSNPFPVPGSLDSSGRTQSNATMSAQIELLDVLIYAFLEVDSNGSAYFFDPWGDLLSNESFCDANAEICNDSSSGSRMLGNFEAFAKLSNSKGLERLISVGGWGHDTSIQNAYENPQTFASSVKAIVSNFGIDGVDIDYEPTSFASDGAQYAALFTTLRNVLGPSTTISMTVAANPTVIASMGDSNWSTIVAVVDFINVMGYDFHGSFDTGKNQITNFQSNLFLDPNDPIANDFSVDGAIQAFASLSVFAGGKKNMNKLVVGFPAYGRGVAGLQSTSNNGLYQPWTLAYDGNLDSPGCTVTPGQSKTCAGMESYSTIVQSLLTSGGFTQFEVSVNGQVSGVHALDASSKTFVSYDDTKLVSSKAAYVKSKGLGGLMMWELSSDIPPGTTGSLLQAASDALGS